MDRERSVTEGSSYVDESMLSGEPVAVSKHKDAKVFAGTINHEEVRLQCLPFFP